MQKDIDDIVYYISNNLKNISAAKKLVNAFIENTNTILNFPYGSPVYNPIGILNNEYRKIKVKNFLMFYTINEKEKTITIVRVLYQNMDISKILE